MRMKAPRLQLRWAPHTGSLEFNWECHYELVISLENWDIRGEVYKGGRLLKKRKNELVVPIKTPSLRSGTRPPCEDPDGSRFGDTPFRDGVHANWDSKQLGDLPVYCIAPDGMIFEIDKY